MKDDLTEEPLATRSNDNVETFRKRLEIFKLQTKLILDFYDISGKLRKLNASSDPETVFLPRLKILDNHCIINFN